MPDNGQVEGMNRTIKEATVRRFHYETHRQLVQHLADFVTAFYFAKRLKAVKGLKPYEFICKAWTSQPELFNANPIHPNAKTEHLTSIRLHWSNKSKRRLGELPHADSMLPHLGRMRTCWMRKLPYPKSEGSQRTCLNSRPATCVTPIRL
jgi:hypothetical protein